MVQYIAQLLTEQDCVIIPEVGGLVGNYRTAQLDLQNSQLRPPSKEIAFNRNLIHNDGLLANRVSVAEGMNYGDALQKVREFSKQCLASLENSGSCVFDGIGRLYFDSDRRLQFSPQLAQNYLQQSYGLPVLELNPVQRYREAARAAEVTAEPQLQKNLVNVASDRWLYAVIGAVAILALVTSFALNISQVEKGTDFSSIFPLPVKERVAAPIPQPLKDLPAPMIAIVESPDDMITGGLYFSESGVSDTDQTWEYVTSQNELRENTLPAVPLPLDTFDRGGYFTIVAGAFVKKHNATRFASELREMGYEVHVMPNGRFSRVGLMFDTSSTTLQAALDSIKKSVEETAWILP